MKYDNWTKWYTQKSNKIDNDNKQTSDLFSKMTKREKETAELLLKQYGNNEKYIAKAKTTLHDIDEQNKIEQTKNQTKKAVAENLVKENNLSKGDNRLNGEQIEKEKIEKSTADENFALQRATRQQEDKTIDELNSEIMNSERDTQEKILMVNQKYDSKERSAFDNLKKDIDYILKNNLSSTGESYYNVKEYLLQQIEENKGELNEKDYKELVDYVEGKEYIEKTVSDSVILYVNDKKVYLSKEKFESADSVSFASHGRLGLIYGELISLDYNGKSYKARTGEIATDSEKNVVQAICSRKKITPKIGVCIMYNGRLYTYAGDDEWRVTQERYKPNAQDGLLALTNDYKRDLERNEDESENN